VVKVKMCVDCNRLTKLTTNVCSCGCKHFVEVILDYTEERQKDAEQQNIPE